MYYEIRGTWLARVALAIWIMGEAVWNAGRDAIQDAVWALQFERRWRRVEKELARQEQARG